MQQEDLNYQGTICSSHLNPEINGTPESQEGDTAIHQSSTDTSQHNSQQDQLSTMPEEDNQEVDPADQDTLVFNSKSDQSDNDLFNTAFDTTSAFISDLVHIPIEQVTKTSN